LQAFFPFITNRIKRNVGRGCLYQGSKKKNRKVRHRARKKKKASPPLVRSGDSDQLLGVSKSQKGAQNEGVEQKKNWNAIQG